MTIVENSTPYGLTVWYDASRLPAGAPSSEVFCFADHGERDVRIAELRELESVVDIRTWEADPGYSLTTFYEAR